MVRSKLWIAAVLMAAPAAAQPRGLEARDLPALRSVGDVQFSPDGTRLAYTVARNDGPGRPYSQLWVMTLADRRSARFGGEREASSGPEWSPDGKWIAYQGKLEGRSGLTVARPDGTGARFLADLEWTNSPLPSTGRRVAWSPDGKRLAFVTSVPGPETQDASGDPIVITRFLYKPDDSEGLSHFNDNRRLHVFVVETATGQAR